MVFKKSLRSCSLDERSLSNGRGYIRPPFIQTEVPSQDGSVHQNRETGARTHVSKGMDRDVMKYEEYG